MDWSENNEKVNFSNILPNDLAIVLLTNFIFFENRFSRKPFELKQPLLIHNLAMTALNGYIAIELFVASVSLNYSYVCQPYKMVNSKDELRVSFECLSLLNVKYQNVYGAHFISIRIISSL